MTDVFISYAREDRDAVRELVRVLESDGHTVWWDREIDVGAPYAEAIDEQLTAADAVVVVWSRHSTVSSWVWAEASAGFEREVLVPVAIDASRIPLPFRGREVAKLTGWPDQRQELELFKLRAAIGQATSRSAEAPDERPQPNLDEIDPTLSIRVANRVAGIMGSGQDTARASQAMAFERALSDCAVQCADVGPSPYLLGEFFGRMRSILAGDAIGLRNDQGDSWGDPSLARELGALDISKPVVITRDAAHPQSAEVLDALGAEWLLAASQRGLVLGVAGREEAAPDEAVLERIPRLLQMLEVLVRTGAA